MVQSRKSRSVTRSRSASRARSSSRSSVNRSVSRGRLTPIRPRLSRPPIGNFLTNFVNDVSNVTRSCLSEPHFLLFLALCAAIIVTHDFESVTGWIFTKCPPATNSFCKFLHDYSNRLPGFLMAIGLFFNTNQRVNAVVSGVYVAVTVIMPGQLFVTYIFSAFAILLYFKISRKTSKMLIIIFAALLIYTTDYIVTPPGVGSRSKATANF